MLPVEVTTLNISKCVFLIKNWLSHSANNQFAPGKGFQANDVDVFKPVEIKEKDQLTSVGDPEKFHLVFGLWQHTGQKCS